MVTVMSFGASPGQTLRVVAAIGHLLAVLGVAQHGDEHLVELNIAAARIGEGADGLLIGLAQIGEERLAIGIDGLVDCRRDGSAVYRRRRRDRHLGGPSGVRLDEREMVQHRMARETELAVDLGPLGPGIGAGEGDAGSHVALGHTIEPPEKIEMPPRAAELTVGDRLQADLFLLLDDARDLAVLDLGQRGGVDLARGVASARLLDGFGAQQAADVIGAEGRLGPLAHRGLLAGGSREF
jgi:hypothetical protein